MSESSDEVDVLGELPSPPPPAISSYSELLKCDYTVHPQWLLDSATTACWYDNPQQYDPMGDIQNNSDDDNQPSTSSDSIKWTNSERKLLQKGIEIYGQDPYRLSVFLGTKSSNDIRSFIETEYGINLESNLPGLESNVIDDIPQYNLQTKSINHEYGEILADNEIPASMEEVITMVSTAEPTVSDIRKSINKKYVPDSPKKKKNISSDNKSLVRTSHDNLEQQLFGPVSNKSDDYNDDSSDFMQNDQINIINEVCNKSNESLMYGLAKKNRTSHVKNIVYDDFKEIGKYSKPSSLLRTKDSKLWIKPDDYECNISHRGKDSKSKFNISLLLDKQSNLSRLSGKKRKGAITSKRKHCKQSLTTTNYIKNIRGKSTFMQIVTGSGQALPLSEGEQVIKIEKYSESGAESDVDIDVDSDSDDVKPQLQIDTLENDEDKKDLVLDKPVESNPEIINNDTEDLSNNEDSNPIVLNIPNSVREILADDNIPSRELIIDDDIISELEKVLYPDFFQGRPTKTPERYLQIRSHLIDAWNQCRPIYLNKTTARNGLRNCGDVNCIGRIHLILEQIGAINFGCEQTVYIRPLMELVNKPTSSGSNILENATLSMEQSSNIDRADMPRQRKKKIFVDGEGGYTITHSKYGEFYEAISEPKQQRHNKKKPINLIYCKTFTDDNPAPYYAQLSLSALILMDVHSYMSRAEVMGLLGGHYHAESSIVSIEKYVPCDSLEDSGTHCDMCPVSQSEASEIIAELGLETVGWHHSHPLFPPQPSSQDILSQADLQTAFSPHPFLAVIVSPYWPPGRTASQYRCFFTKKEKSDDYNVAYRFKTHLNCDIKNEEDVVMLINDIEKLRKRNNTFGKFIINMQDVCPVSNMSYLDKCLSSVKHHLNSCDIKINTPVWNNILSGISNQFV